MKEASTAPEPSCCYIARLMALGSSAPEILLSVIDAWLMSEVNANLRSMNLWRDQLLHSQGDHEQRNVHRRFGLRHGSRPQLVNAARQHGRNMVQCCGCSYRYRSRSAGSAAFNLLVISAVCVCAIPDGEACA